MPDRIIVLGAGPAGGAVALGLVRLGYAVTVIAQPRPFDAVEGISERVVEGLRAAGFNEALEVISAPSARNATWNGASNSANSERLVNRRALDAAIWRDLATAGVDLVAARVSGVEIGEQRVTVTMGDSAAEAIMSGRFLVEARGRSAPGAHLERLRGAETVSLLQYWEGEPAAPQSAAVSFEDGWAWMAMTPDGNRYLQLTFDVATTQLPAKGELVDYCNRRLAELPQAQPFMSNARATGQIYARTSTPILCRESIGDNWIRVGDAAMAVDPLSGNGIFQALSSALQAPAVIHTLLSKPQNRELAKRFHQSRVDALFFRFARIGRDFYALESNWPEQPFWQQRSQWPDTEPLHRQETFDGIRIETLPVLNNGVIDEAEVIVTQDQPLGIWHMAGIELAPVVRAVKSRGTQTLEACLAPLALEDAQQGMVLRWLHSLGVN